MVKSRHQQNYFMLLSQNLRQSKEITLVFSFVLIIKRSVLSLYAESGGGGGGGAGVG